MRNRELVRQLQSIRTLINRTNSASMQNIELQGHWGRYLCILAAGFLENALREVYSDFVNNAANPSVASFAIKTLDSIQNPKSIRFVETARAFNTKWGDELEYFIEIDDRKNAIDSIMNNRHQIAHGKSTQISVARVREYLDKSVQVIEFIESQCLGPNITR